MNAFYSGKTPKTHGSGSVTYQMLEKEEDARRSDAVLAT